MSFSPLSNKVHFPDLENEVQGFWDKHDTFQKSLAARKSGKSFVFYDGPPFATGLPHFGNLLAGTIKDIIPRYQTMKGHYVERRFGWDCHGLPIEMEIQKELGLMSNADIEKHGVAKFNETCRSVVLRYTHEWEKTVRRIGRWVDFKNDYKTMNLSFMESVWWVFKSLYEKGLIYEGFKVLPYSWASGTPLSNFEANLNYKDVQDPAITIRFECVDEPNTSILAWTTTPWTLISNLALCVNESLDYVKYKNLSNGSFYYIGASRLAHYLKEGEYEIVARLNGKDLKGKKYRALFPYAAKEMDTSKCYRVLADDYVTDTDGTGIVHQAPAYGEDDNRVCQAAGIGVYDPVDGDGNFKNQIDFIAGKNIKEADKDIIRHLKEAGLLFKH
ncbi:MAG: class I tRNA ligase family protein, partial [Spirochaetia bacterium]|nr:class I tRNA ligase family protein [Spirochaetia bacterium]